MFHNEISLNLKQTKQVFVFNKKNYNNRIKLFLCFKMKH